MNEAIKLAIEKGGYKNPYEYSEQVARFFPRMAGHLSHRKMILSATALDPLFWQALGKALGWGKYICEYCRNDFDPPETRAEVHALCIEHGLCKGMWVEGWKPRAHRYFDLLLTGGDTEKFWNELLKQ